MYKRQRPEYYADLYRRYSTYCRNYDGNRLFKIASGASDYDYKWTDVLMNRVGHRMDGLSLHYYTVTGWSGSKGSATQFNKDDYYWTMGKCLEVEDVLKKHCTIMDKYDKDKKIALLLDCLLYTSRCRCMDLGWWNSPLLLLLRPDSRILGRLC